MTFAVFRITTHTFLREHWSVGKLPSTHPPKKTVDEISNIQLQNQLIYVVLNGI